MIENATSMVFLGGYFGPLLILISVGPALLHRRGVPGVLLLVASASLATGALLAVVGRWYSLAIGSHIVVGLGAVAFAATVFAAVLVGPAITLIVLNRRRASLRRQQIIPFAVGVMVQILATPVYLLGVGCALGMGCVGI